ncbi:MAG: TRAP transporter substrate-binding protein [Rhizobiales bacterium]|nr:TRAP transporter substrate-binding protein [Hyphomicrobiales bacterium]
MRVHRRMVLAAGLVTAPAIVSARTERRWRMVTSWSRNLVGPGVTAERLARRITAMSDGALVVELFAAGEVVPALSVFDAVSNGTVEMGHSAALFQAGKWPVASVFTTVPFGLPPIAHAGWLDHGGQALWDSLYAPSGVKPILAGNTGPSSAGWFRKSVESLADLAGLRIRATGLGSELYRRMGATPVALAPGETYPALERGVLDAAEFLAPANDAALGLHRIAPFLALPGFNKPNGASELLVARPLWEGLPAHLQAVIEAAARMEHDLGLAEAHRLNAEALRSLIAAGTTITRLSPEILARGAILVEELLAEIAARDSLSARIVESYRAYRNDATRAWENLTRI